MTYFQRLLAINPLKASKWPPTALYRLIRRLNNPQDDYPSVHIAGTNGKGSVAFKLARSLSLSGYKVGLFTSPHLISYRERVTVDGEKISSEELEHLLGKLFDLTEQEGLSRRFFELTTLLGLMTFSRKQVDLAVIETGIGGRLDPTNVIRPLVSVITSIERDHCDLLGYCLDGIAREKGGIIKKGVPVVVGPRAFFSSISAKAAEQRAPLYRVEESPEDTERENQLIAEKTLEVLSPSFPLSRVDRVRGCMSKLPCRFEIRGNTIYDVAHNVAAFQRLFKKIGDLFPSRPIHCIFAFSKKEELERCLIEIEPHIAFFYPAPISHPRLLRVCDFKPFNKMVSYDDLKELALDVKKRAHSDKGIILVSGSFYMMEPVKRAFKELR